MKSLKEQLDQALNEARNYPYDVALSTKKGIVKVKMTLENPADANAVDEWLENEKDNSIYAADGGPNDVEI